MKKRLVLLISILLVCALSFAVLAGCSAEVVGEEIMSTLMNIKIEGSGSSELSVKVQNYVRDIEKLLSPSVKGSDIYNINHSKAREAVKVSDETLEVMKIAEQAYNLSGGAYDPSVSPLVKLWKFSPDTFTIQGIEVAPPSDAEIDARMAVVGLYKCFSVDYVDKTITKLVDGAMLDFGGVAKGYVVERAIKMANEKQKMLFDLGRNIGSANDTYRIGISSPRQSDRAYVGIVDLTHGETICTSADSERYYLYPKSDGASTGRYCHIINPLTGRSIDTNSDGALVSVTIISEHGGLGDALATATMVLGKDKGTKMLKDNGVKALLIYSDLSFEKIGEFGFEV